MNGQTSLAEFAISTFRICHFSIAVFTTFTCRIPQGLLLKVKKSMKRERQWERHLLLWVA
jgi:hypothetical protein